MGDVCSVLKKRLAEVKITQKVKKYCANLAHIRETQSLRGYRKTRKAISIILK